MNRHPWSAWYWDDWDRDTAHLSHVHYSIYHRLLKHYYRTQKPLIANAADLLRICLAIGEAEQAALQDVLSQFFDLESDGYHNRRADSEIQKAVSISDKRKMAGSKGGKQTANAQQKASKTVASAKQVLPHPHPQSHTQEKRGKAPSRQFTQDDFDERDARKLAEAKRIVLGRVNRAVGSGQQFTEGEFMTAVCEESGLLPARVRELEKKSKWKEASA